MKVRPTCINHGCDRPCHDSGSRYRPVCGPCHMAGYKGTPLPFGVTPFKTGYCSNSDGHLGFVCAIDYAKAPWAVGQTQIDHIDGNYLNNVLSNVDELCQLCHQRKGMLSGDFKNQGVYFHRSRYFG